MLIHQLTTHAWMVTCAELAPRQSLAPIPAQKTSSAQLDPRPNAQTQMPLSQLSEVSLLKPNVSSALQARSVQHSQSGNTTVQQETTALVDTKTYH